MSTSLTITERASLKRLFGITVCREVEGIAHCCNANGERCQYAISQLRAALAHRPLRQRIIKWLTGRNAA